MGGKTDWDESASSWNLTEKWHTQHTSVCLSWSRNIWGRSDSAPWGREENIQWDLQLSPPPTFFFLLSTYQVFSTLALLRYNTYFKAWFSIWGMCKHATPFSPEQHNLHQRWQILCDLWNRLQWKKRQSACFPCVGWESWPSAPYLWQSINTGPRWGIHLVACSQALLFFNTGDNHVHCQTNYSQNRKSHDVNSFLCKNLPVELFYSWAYLFSPCCQG